jgi:DNA-binding response OmpR family regulator
MIAGNSSKRDAHQTSVQAKKYRVMIVDDEQDITTIFKIGLEKNEFIVTTFNDPFEALSTFSRGMYDLLIVDVRMPGMNGFELYQKIRNLDEKVKVCFLTAFEDYRKEFKASFTFLNEVNCYLKKPITVHDLIKRLMDLAGS